MLNVFSASSDYSEVLGLDLMRLPFWLLAPPFTEDISSEIAKRAFEEFVR